ncbi:MAG: hypothetical protein KIT56_00690 [Gammaproteobacteria bacterium]|nr:hypothetical protein [Gammaproteobacteria bacterium]MCW5582403.1 hypothetical protein [Gammaproteobacteria bacterium]
MNTRLIETDISVAPLVPNTAPVMPQTYDEQPTICYPTSIFSDWPDYQEGAMRDKGTVYFGSLYHLGTYHDDIKIKGEASVYIGRVLWPQRVARGYTIWSYEINMAFWAGIIDQKRSLLLLTDIKQYPKKNGEKSGTISELLWLQDNEYTFAPNPNDPMTTYCYPPKDASTPSVIIDYRFVNSNDSLNRVRKLRDEVLDKRKHQFGHQLSKNTLYKKRDHRRPSSYNNTRGKIQKNRFNNARLATTSFWNNPQRKQPQPRASNKITLRMPDKSG